MLALVLTLLFTAFPSNSATSWMRPDAFHLELGMSRGEAARTLSDSGFQVKAGKKADELYFDYTDSRTVTLHFANDRLWSVRFELFAFLGEVRKAFDEVKTDLRKQRGAPKKLASKTIVVYDETVPNVMVVVSDDPQSENGRKGIGFLAVRYYAVR
jgi:hypothetical protein